MGVSKRKRFEIFKRDKFTCQYCGRKSPAVVLECDHIQAVANGGTDEIENLVTACFDCNRGKSDAPLQLEEREQRLLEVASMLNGFDKVDNLIGFAKAFSVSFANDINAECRPPVKLLNDEERRGAAYFELLGMIPFYVIDVSHHELATTDGTRNIVRMNQRLKDALPKFPSEEEVDA